MRASALIFSCEASLWMRCSRKMTRLLSTVMSRLILTSRSWRSWWASSCLEQSWKNARISGLASPVLTPDESSPSSALQSSSWLNRTTPLQSALKGLIPAEHKKTNSYHFPTYGTWYLECKQFTIQNTYISVLYTLIYISVLYEHDISVYNLKIDFRENLKEFVFS